MPGFRKLRLSDPAKGDLSQIAEHTGREWGVAQKRKYLGQLRDGLRALRDTPGLGTPRDDIAPGLKAHPVGSHVVFYRETRAAVVIVRVLHKRMDVPSHLASPGRDPRTPS